ncbi:tensin-3, partial [Copidosoma floridanum]|uniref:tensin-3 n=1 Tax=Copidosoma floridanum TaxID=29053 RepID=UPI000C6FBF80
SEFEPQCHVFRTKRLRKPRPCQLCHQAVIKQASCCRVCKYTCHKACEDKDSRYRDTSQQIYKQWQADPARAFPTVGNGSVTNSGTGDATDSPTKATSYNSSVVSFPLPSSITISIHNGGYETQPRNASTPVRNKQLQQQQQQQQQQQHEQPQRTPGVGADATAVVSSNGYSNGRVSEVMELCYVTERIIALWYREDARGVLEHATSLLRGKHADNYMIFNLSSSQASEPNTREVGWPQALAPSLERLCALCKELDSWLNAASNRVVVLHARGSKERLGVAVSAYMNYSSICGSRDQALDRFAMRRFLDDKIGPLGVPSHRRYIEYFSGLLASSLLISQSPLYLTHLTVLGVPMFEPTGCRAFFKVYEGLTPIYTSDLYSVTNTREFAVNLGGLRLRGDILVKCYHRVYSNQGREVVFSLQFHTGVITENVVSFPRSELDVACEDPRCPPDSVVTLYFASDPKRLDGPTPAPTPAVPHASAHHDPVLHWDSYTNLELSDDEGRETPLSPPPPPAALGSSAQTSPRGLSYTRGPDGSLYAVVQTSGTHGAGTRGSPLTVSMDSGISSAPPQRPSPPEPTHQEPESLAHTDLDKLLQDMMLTVESMPDPPNDEYNRPMQNGPSKMYIHEQHPPTRGGSSAYSTLKDSYRSYNNNCVSSSSSTVKESSPPYSSSSYSTLKQHSSSHRPGYDSVDFARGSPDQRAKHDNGSFSPPGNIDYIDEDIPYHARQTSQPFSYGATNEMIKHQKLSSPSLVRKASLRGGAPVADLDDILGESGRRPASPLSPTPDPPPEFANGPVPAKPQYRDKDTDGQSWLKQQQLKLAARRDERSPARLWRQETGNRMIGELRSVQKSRMRHDGYASDSAVLDDRDDDADDDDDDDAWALGSPNGQSTMRSTTTTTTTNMSAPASPLLPQRSSSWKLNGGVVGSGSYQQSRPRAVSVNERPFVAAKRAYEYKKHTDSHSPLLQKLSNGHQQQQRQPPRPESRSDSYARTESFLREHSRLLSSSLSNHSSGNHVAFDLDREGSSAVSSRYPSRPESRNQSSSYHLPACNGITRKESNGLLTTVDQPAQNSATTDPLVSLIESLAEIRPLSEPVVTARANGTNTNTNNNNNKNHKCTNVNNGLAKPLPHESHHKKPAVVPNATAGLVTVPGSATNTRTSNQSPKAWQNCTTAPKSHNDSPSSWTERSVSPGSAPVTASRPQTPAFPVHPRTPYVNNNNNASPSVTFASDRPTHQPQHHYAHHANNSLTASYGNNNAHAETNNNKNVANYGAERTIFIEERRDARETGLPPKSPTTQRRLSFPENSGLAIEPCGKRWPLTKQSASFDYSKDRPVSPLDEIVGNNSYSRGPGTPTHAEYGHGAKFKTVVKLTDEIAMSAVSYTSINSAGHSSTHTQYYGSRRSSVLSNTEPHEVADANVKFVRDTSKIWYKPNISREQAIGMLRDAPPGTFVVRDSNSFPGAFGLALKVATPPSGAPTSPREPSNELVRHFLIEPTSRGVRLKGCANEPVFSSLSALVYQHSLMAMALPCQLLLPEPEAAVRAIESSSNGNGPQQLLAQGAACNVLYLFTMDTESLTGPQAIKKTITALFDQKSLPSATIVHFKVSSQGITLTDNARKLFFRRHYPTSNISYCGLDTEERTWDFVSDNGRPLSEHRCFGFVARKPAHKSDNQCHVFAELEPEQPATAIVNFVNKVMMGSAHAKANIV